MSVRTLRWSGWLLLVGSGLFIVGSLPSLVAASFAPTATSIQLSSLLIGALLVVVGLPVSYRKQARQIGWGGRIGFIAIELTALLLGVVVNVVFLVSDAPAGGGALPPSPLFLVAVLLGGLCALIGGLLYGIMTIRARVFPAVSGWLLIIAGLLSLTVFVAPDVLNRIGGTASDIAFFLAFGWMGYRLAYPSPKDPVSSPVS